MKGNNFNENTRVQVPAALHLCRLGYTYLEVMREPVETVYKEKLEIE
ncbi:MAG: hypothetical protein K2J46_01685 [Muribaculaceae bacterium]|nr:hypothetical protein [Muribaculaceae bacterium]